ncbi:MAG TPA: 30S ribosome-binding factor RbfA [Candidatus Gastranaerophilales bacterium]|nr:30S ribosome-binding factor RbfA [Candidatus Gastranaerophilales bacterium]
MNTRGEKIKKALIKEISDIVQKGIKDPRIEGIISVTDVELSADYKHAKVYISIFGEQEHKQRVMEAIEESAPFVRKEVGRRIRLRNTPELRFYLDESLEKGQKLTELIDKISRGEL